MKTHFYSHLISFDLIQQNLESLELTHKEKKKLLELAHTNLHHEILDAILSELSEKDKKIFLSYLGAGQNKKIWQHLNSNIEAVEEKIKKVAENLKKELKADIHKIK